MSCFDNTPEKKLDKTLDKELKKYQKQEEKVFKLLLLGAGGCGKSTIFKQMKILHQNGYSEEELKKNKEVLKRNILDIFQIMVWFVEDQEIDIEYDEEFLDEFKEITFKSFVLDSDMCDKLEKLWKDPAMQEAYNRRNEYDLMDNAKYFVDKVRDIANPDYTPTTEDVLRSRVKTIGISEKDFQVKGANFKMIDVGGQRNERRKWIHAFDNVTCVLFVTSLSEYDQVLAEEDTQNRTEESLQLFKDICNHQYFKNKNVMIFFNKSDLFEEKIVIKPITTAACYSGYTGAPEDKDASLKFIQDSFVMLNSNRKREIFTHVTNATDTGNVKKVFAAVRTTLLQKALGGDENGGGNSLL